MIEPLDPRLAIGNTAFDVGDFWAWAFSSLAENATRGVFAEFLVAAALGTTRVPRVEWDAADLRYRDALIEVKSSADHQVWAQARPSTIRFDVANKFGWNAATGEYATEQTRSAQVYVFCHYRGIATSHEVVRLEHWDFYVLSTTVLDAALGDQKSLGLMRLRTLTEPRHFDDLRATIDVLLDRH